MSALSEASTPAQDAAPPSIDTQQLQQPPQLTNDLQGLQNPSSSATISDGLRKLRRACTACHAGKTRCSEVLPCQSCLKRGLGATCTYPDPEADNVQNQAPPPQVNFAAMAYPPPPTMHSLGHSHYYDYNAFANASTSTFRPSKRPRPLTEEETAAITRNFTRGDFFVGSSAPFIFL
ncbi:hypothetical protein A0H81_01452 [Grifola frondosa]|uniref:Zn(2)-C6 fungal-type domain-containing protein n=1 Tax=Grifola frondosa TaxID=5627 RepID=A0A1C7MTU4_GRIFR|nr:hypothetical protein A0H81_01452 [Grifola frondosa]